MPRPNTVYVRAGGHTHTLAHIDTETPVSNGAGPECANFKDVICLSAAFQ